MAIVDSSGNSQKSYTYDVYGEATPSGGLANEFDFAGQQTDGTGLQYLRARYYDPETGTFLSREPFAKGAAWLGNPHGYGGGNPARFTDPSGLFLVEEGEGANGCHHECTVDFDYEGPAWERDGGLIDWREVGGWAKDAGEGTLKLAALIGEYLARPGVYCTPDGTCTSQEQREAFATALEQCAEDTTCAFAATSGLTIVLAGVTISIAVLAAPVGLPLGAAITITLAFAGIEISWGTFVWYQQSQ